MPIFYLYNPVNLPIFIITVQTITVIKKIILKSQFRQKTTVIPHLTRYLLKFARSPKGCRVKHGKTVKENHSSDNS